MKNIIAFPNYEIREYRKKCCFKPKAVQLEAENGELYKYPCIVLYEKETDIPIFYTGLEKYICNLVESELLKSGTLLARAYAVCHFLNYIIEETNINSIHECSVNTIRNFQIFMKKKENGEDYNRDTWLRYRDYVFEFLKMYYKKNKNTLFFQYNSNELTSEKKHYNKLQQRRNVDHNASLGISAPISTHKKNRILIDGYFDLLLYEAKKYEPDIVLGIVLQAYAGLRAGEVVNVSCGRIRIIRKSFGMVSEIQIDLTGKAPYFKNWEKKTNPGSIKKFRKQKVYNDFILEFRDLYEQHLALMEAKGLDTSKDAPLFVNDQGNPMTVQTYSDRVKQLFYERFLPSLKKTCEYQGTYADNAAYIEAYESEYPGSHMFRHLFTMYLLTKAKLTTGEIMKWRGDSNQESMNDYIHENRDLVDIFKESSYTFQLQILEDIYSDRR